MPKRPPRKPPKAAPELSKGALPPQQASFAREYLVDLNGKQAAIRAGYSPKTAEMQASRLLRSVKVKRVVDAALKKRAAKTEITQEKVLKELTVLAHSNVDDYQMDEGGRLVPAEGKPPAVMRAVSSVKYRSRTIGAGKAAQVVREVEFRLWDKPGTLKLEGRHVGLFPNEVKLEVGEETLAGILGRAAARGLNGR